MMVKDSDIFVCNTVIITHYIHLLRDNELQNHKHCEIIVVRNNRSSGISGDL